MDGEETTSSSKAAAPATIRLVNFISEEQLDEAKRSRGERVEDGTAQRDKPLFQILQENKDKKDAEFNERFKHRPPKALDEDESEFLDKLALSRREYEQQVANEEAEQLRSFHEAVAAQSTIAHELVEIPTVSRPEESKPKPPVKRSQPALLRNIMVSVKPQAKKRLARKVSLLPRSCLRKGTIQAANHQATPRACSALWWHMVMTMKVATTMTNNNIRRSRTLSTPMRCNATTAC